MYLKLIKDNAPMQKKLMHRVFLLSLFVVSTFVVIFQSSSIMVATAAGDCSNSPYDASVLADKPVAYWQLGDTGNTVNDCSAAKKHPGTYANNPKTTQLSNGDTARVFDGASQYAQIPDADDLSITKTGILTIEAWMRPDTLQFPHQEAEGYVHWMGKGKFGQDEYVSRMYSLTNGENRPNRISGYAFNLPGGLGAGSYFQDTVTAGEWIHYTLVINSNAKSGAYPSGYTKIFKNGVQRDQDSLKDYSIVPRNGTEPFRIGTRDMNSFFKGAIGKVAVYDYELTPSKLLSHYNNRSAKQSSIVPGVPSPQCIGSCPTIGEQEPMRKKLPSPTKTVAPTITSSVSPTAGVSEVTPTKEPCASTGTLSVLHTNTKQHHKGHGKISNGFKKFLELIIRIIEWIFQLINGGTSSFPSAPDDPSPCTTPTDTPLPTNSQDTPSPTTATSVIPSVVPTTSTSVNSCALPKYPNPSCTGVPAGTSLATVNGDVTLKTPGQVYEGKHVTGSIFVAAANVTIRKSQIDGNVVNHNYGDPKFTIEDSTVGKEGSCTKDTAIDESNYTATRVKVLGHGDGFGDSGVGNILIQDSFVKLCASDASYHSDGVQGYLGGTNVIIRHNTIDQRPAAIGATAPVFISDQSKDADVEDNLLAGGSQTIRVYYFGGKDIVKNNRVVNNSWVYGPVSSSCDKITWSGNTLVTIDANYNVTSTVGPLACAN